MILGGFDNALKVVQQNVALMQQGNNFNVVNSLSSAVNLIQNLANLVQTGNVGGMLGQAIMAKLTELDGIFNMLGPQHLAMFGIPMSGSGNGAMNPFQPSVPINNQSFFYPTMGPQFQQQPQFGMHQPMQQMQQPMPQQMQQQPMQQMQQPVQAAPPPPPPSGGPEIMASVPPPPSGGGGGPSVFMGLPGAGSGDDKPAAGRDFLLSLLNQK